MMKTFQAKFKKNSEGVFAISLVSNPATQENFIALSEQEEIVTLSKVDEEQRILMGLVLQPNQLIYRKNGDQEFNIVFSEDTIKELSHNFFKSGFQLNSKLEHQSPIEGVTFVESWLVENSEIDKSANFGMKYPKGSWIATMKVDNDEIWNDYIKTGELKGFSVDAMVDLEEVNFNTNIEMAEEKQMNRLEKMLLWFEEKLNNDQEVKLGSVLSGDVKIEFEGDTLEKGANVFVMAEDEKVALPDGEYPTEEYGTLLVKDGRVEDMVAKQEEDVMSDDEFKQVMEALMSKQNETFEAKLSEIKKGYEAELQSLKDEVVKLSEQPAAKPIRSTPTQVELTKQGKLLEKLRNNK